MFVHQVAEELGSDLHDLLEVALAERVGAAAAMVALAGKNLVD